MGEDHQNLQCGEYLVENIRLNVILVEQDDLLANSINIELQKYKADVHRAEELKDLLLFIEKEKLEIVIIDVNHNTIDACRVIKAVRSSRSNSKVPIVVLVPNGNATLLEPVCRVGATNFVPKPIVWYQFHQIMQSIHWSMIDQRRKYRRVAVSIRVLCTFDDKKIITHTVDISAGGMLLKLEEDIPISKELTVTFPYVEELAAPFLFPYRVARIINVSGGGKLAAIEFMDMSASQSERLISWIDMFHYIDDTKVGN